MIDLKGSFSKTILMATGAAMLVSAASVSSFAREKQAHDYIVKAVENSQRPEKDIARDANRKPAEVLEFSGIKPGMVVVDINSGGGYYTEILSRAVGGEGTVYAHNGPVYWDFVKDSVGERYDGRLANVKQLHSGSENIDIVQDSADIAIAVLAYHDYYFKHKARKGDEDVPSILGSIYKALKPGGSFVVVDHVAPAGSGTEAGNTLHRIDPELVKEQILAAGFKLDSVSSVLANPEDNHTISPFAPEIRGKTDRFIFKFVK